MAATSRPTLTTGGEQSSGKPKRLRPWLENLLNRNEIPGLCWVDSDKTMFKIPWKHRGKQDWSPDHSRIFKEWAVQTGRYQDGQPEDYPTWKTRLRCAFNKAPDIEEVREKRCIDSSEPYRIYRFKPATPSSATPGISGATTRVYGSHSAQSPTNLDEMFNQLEAEVAESNTCDAEALAMNKLHRTATWCLQLPELGSSEAAMQAATTYDGGVLSSTQYDNNHKRMKLDLTPDDYEQKVDAPMLSASALGPNAFSILSAAGQKLPKLTGKASPLKYDADIKPNIATTLCAVDKPPQDEKLNVIVRYCGRTVVERVVNSPTGCYICFNPTSLSRLLAPADAELIVLPACTSDEKFSPKEGGKIQSVMDELLKKGLAQPLFIRCIGQDIYVHRTCQCATYYYKQEMRSSAGAHSIRQPIKIRRTIIGQPETETQTCIFDHDCYVSELKDYLDERDRKPDPYCRLVFGQELPYNRVDETGALITVLVATTRALEDLSKAEAAIAQRTPDIHFSNPTDMDGLMHEISGIEFNESLQQSQHMETVPFDLENALCFYELLNVQYSPNEDQPENPIPSHGTVPTTTTSFEAGTTTFTFNPMNCANDVTAQKTQ